MSTSANVVTLRSTDERSDRLAGLLERRAEFETELKRLAAPQETRSRATSLLGEVEAELAELDRSERGAWVAWADNLTGEQPTPRADERRELERRRSLAAADLRSASAACEAVEGRLANLNGELRQLAGQIYECKLQQVLDEAGELEQQFNDAHKIAGEKLAQLRGLYVAFCEEKAAAMARGDEQVSMGLQSAISRLEALKAPDIPQNYGETLAQAAKWRASLR